MGDVSVNEAQTATTPSKAWEMFLARQAPAVLNQVRIQTRTGIKGGMSYSLLDERAAGGGLLEQSVMVCNHCGVNVIVNPDRTRERASCRHCNHYICDSCNRVLIVEGVCTSLQQSMDLLYEAALKGTPELIQPFNRRKSPEDLALREASRVF